MISIKNIFLLILSSVLTSFREVPLHEDVEAKDETSEISEILSEKLEEDWTFWHDDVHAKGLDKNNYLKKLEKGASFGTVSEFWKQWNDILKSSYAFSDGSNIRLFKKDISPAWEDPSNREGGNWQVILQTKTREEAIQEGLSLLLAMIRGRFGYQSEICGAVLSVKVERGLGYVFTMWNKHGKDNQQIETVASKLGKLLNEPHVQYRPHKIAMQINKYQMRKYRGKKDKKEPNDFGPGHIEEPTEEPVEELTEEPTEEVIIPKMNIDFPLELLVSAVFVFLILVILIFNY